MSRLWVLIALSLIWAVCIAHAETEQLPKPSALPIEISAQQLDADRQQRQATFLGEVVAKQGDITLYADKLIVHSMAEEDQVDRLEAFGNVRVVQLDRTALADRAVYRQADGILVLYGNAEVYQGQNKVTGTEITVFLRENRSVVKSGETGRVKAILFPQQQSGEEQNPQ